MLTHLSHSFMKYRWLNLINQLLGLILLSEWIVLFNIHFFNPENFLQRVEIIKNMSSFNFLNSFYFMVVSNAPWISYMACVALLIVSALMILRLYRWVINWCGVVISFIYVSSHLTYPGTWLFQYASPFIFMVIIALSTHHDKRLSTFKEKVLGFHTVVLLPNWLNIFVGLVYSAFIFYFLIVSESAGMASQKVGIETGIFFFILFVVSEIINKYRLTQNDLTEEHDRYIEWMNYHWLDYILMAIGIMIICQVIMDEQLNWFTKTGYQDLISVYAQSTDSPLFIRHFLTWASSQSVWLAPVQQAIESFLAIAAVLLVYRLPVALGIFGLCLMLTFSEFGVPATWPPTAHAELTWTWELLNITLVVGVVTLYQLSVWLSASTTVERVLGEGVFSNLSYSKSMFINFLMSLTLCVYILLTHSLKLLNHSFAIQAGLACFLFLSITVAIDRLRKKSNHPELLN